MSRASGEFHCLQSIGKTARRLSAKVGVVVAGGIRASALAQPQCGAKRLIFMARHFSHAETRADKRALAKGCPGGIPDGSCVFLVADCKTVAQARWRNDDFILVGKGCSLDKPHRFADGIHFQHGTDLKHFYIDGPSDSADPLSRNIWAEAENGPIIRRPARTTCLPSSQVIYDPAVENIPFKPNRKVNGVQTCGGRRASKSHKYFAIAVRKKKGNDSPQYSTFHLHIFFCCLLFFLFIIHNGKI